ncbi:hypothetical protein GCM10028801_41290 [Nocardioides maradonensis]
MTVTIRAVNPAGKAVAFQPTDFEGDTGGVGGWESIARPRQVSAAAWVGGVERTLTLPLEINGIEAIGVARDSIISGDLAIVRSWGAKNAIAGQPPILKVTGAARVVDADRWVLTNIDWGEYELNERGLLVRQALTLTLLQYFAAPLVKGPAKKSRQRKGKH